MDPARLIEFYDRLRSKMIHYLERRRCPYADELADEALYRTFVRPGLPDEGIDNVEAFAFGVLKFVFLEWLRKRKMEPLDRPEVAETSFERQINAGVELEELLQNLSENERALLTDFYMEEKTAGELIPKYGRNEATIRGTVMKLLNRIRKSTARRRGNAISTQRSGTGRHT